MPLSARSFIRTSLPTMSEGILSVLLDTRRARRKGLAAIAQRQREHLSEMVAFARANSPYYHRLYEHLPQRVQDPAMLPVVGKQTLMLHFDDWVTDREVTIETVRAFVNSPDLVGERFLGKLLTPPLRPCRRGLSFHDLAKLMTLLKPFNGVGHVLPVQHGN